MYINIYTHMCTCMCVCFERWNVVRYPSPILFWHVLDQSNPMSIHWSTLLSKKFQDTSQKLTYVPIHRSSEFFYSVLVMIVPFDDRRNVTVGSWHKLPLFPYLQSNVTVSNPDPTVSEVHLGLTQIYLVYTLPSSRLPFLWSPKIGITFVEL